MKRKLEALGFVLEKYTKNGCEMERWVKQGNAVSMTVHPFFFTYLVLESGASVELACKTLEDIEQAVAFFDELNTAKP